MVQGSNGTQVNAAKARSSVREDGPAVSQSMNPTNVPSRQTAFHGATSWWPITKPGRQVCPANQDMFAGTLLNWATESVSGEVDFRQEVAWLATVLEARDFPTDRLARNLDIGADVVSGEVGGPGGRKLAAVLTATAGFVRSGDFRDYTV